jgi:hypothetical protein
MQDLQGGIEMEGQMDLFNPPDMHIVNARGELREAPSWMDYKRCENCSAWEMLENNKQPPEGWGIYGWCKETIQRSQGTSYCMKFEDKLGNLKRMIK